MHDFYDDGARELIKRLKALLGRQERTGREMHGQGNIGIFSHRTMTSCGVPGNVDPHFFSLPN